MAAWKGKLAGYPVVIHEVDHYPPHCHVELDGRDVRVHLLTLQVLKPPPNDLPAPLRRELCNSQEELLEAWERVHVFPPPKRS